MMTDLIFANASEEAGWNPESQVQILLEYIGNQNSDSAFEDFLRKKIASEKRMTKTALDFDTFQSLWLEQECDGMDNPEDVYQLKEAIENALDYEDLFKTIMMWSNKPLIERVTNFLERNNAVLDEDGYNSLLIVSGFY